MSAFIGISMYVVFVLFSCMVFAVLVADCEEEEGGDGHEFR